MRRRMTLGEQLARAWYELQPAVVDGRQVPFEDAPVALVEHCYERAHETLVMLSSERQNAA